MSQTVNPASLTPRSVIDVRHLPTTKMDEKSPLWWGNTLLMLIETTSFAILIASYFFVRMNFTQWPPPKPDWVMPMIDANPDLKFPTANLLLVVLSCGLAVALDRAARKMKGDVVRILLFALVAVAGFAVYLRFREFPAVRFWWNDNAYASCVWSMLGLHLTYLLAGGLEFLVMGAWVLTHRFDEKHAHDVTLACIYWYWTALVHLIMYGIICWVPRVM